MMPTIKAISQQLGLSAHTIRFYEKEGMVTIPRNDKGIREFDAASIDRLKAIAHYRRVGMSLEDIRSIFGRISQPQALDRPAGKKNRASLEQQIADLQETHQFLVQKIKLHRQLAEMAEQGVSLEERMTIYHQFKLDYAISAFGCPFRF